MTEQPSPNGSNGAEHGRDAGGRFAKGNPGGPGNPFARRTAGLRALIVAEVTDDDLQGIVRKLIVSAKAGDLSAVKVLFAYTIGRPPEADADAGGEDVTTKVIRVFGAYERHAQAKARERLADI